MTVASLRKTLVLTGVLARSEFKLRYSGSVLGFLWSAVKPLALFAILYFAFSYVMRFGEGVDQYPLQLLLAIVLWTFFAEATLASTTVLVSRADMIRKIAFPRIVLPLSVGGTALLAMTFNLLAVLAICIATGLTPTWSWLLLPLVLFELVLLTVGVSLMLAASYVRFRDIGQIWDLGSQLLFYATPIIYPIALVPERLRTPLLVNPLAQIIQDARAVVIAPATSSGLESVGTLARVAPFVITVALFIAGFVVFQRAADRAAEHV